MMAFDEGRTVARKECLRGSTVITPIFILFCIFFKPVDTLLNG